VAFVALCGIEPPLGGYEPLMHHYTLAPFDFKKRGGNSHPINTRPEPLTFLNEKKITDYNGHLFGLYCKFEDDTKVNNFLQIAQLFFAQIAKIFLPLHHGEEKIRKPSGR